MSSEDVELCLAQKRTTRCQCFITLSFVNDALINPPVANTLAYHLVIKKKVTLCQCYITFHFVNDALTNPPVANTLAYHLVIKKTDTLCQCL